MTFYADMEEVKLKVSRLFDVEDVFLDAGVLTFIVSNLEIKERFKKLYMDLKPTGLIPAARRDEDGRVVIKVYPAPRVRLPIPKMKSLPLILFVATLGTVSIDGFFRAASPTLLGKIAEGLLYMTALMAIIGVHELGHKISAKIDGMESSPPYFIPGIPTLLPTFGAVIFQKSPVVNRDDMFDVGFSGPLAGFLVAIGVAAVAYSRALWLTPAELEALSEEIGRLPSPLIFYLFLALFQTFWKPNMIPVLTAVGFAAWLGMLITALNLFPVWQLDGGRIFRSLLSARQHRIAGYISIAILAFTGYFFFAILLLLMMPRTPDIAPLDQVSPLSRGRKLAFAAVFTILILSFVPLWL